MIKFNNLNLNLIHKQIAKDFPMLSVHSERNKIANRYDFLVFLAVQDYIDLAMKEWECKKRHALTDNCEHWSLGHINYKELCYQAKELVAEQAARDAIIVQQVEDVYQKAATQKRFSLKAFFIHLCNCFYVALWSDIYEDFR